MTTKEEKARLAAIRTIMIEVVAEIDEILGETQERDFIAAKVKKEEEYVPLEPKGGDIVGPSKIGDLNIGDEGIIVEAEILDFERNSGTTKKGKAYEVLKATLSDKSGPIKLVLWNEQVEQFGDLQIGDIIRVEAWKVERGYKGGVFELVYGQFGTINKVEKHII